MTLKPIVAAVDGSEESLRAAEWAALEARRHHAPLRIVSVPALLPQMRADAHLPERVVTALYTESCRALREAVARCGEIAPGQVIDAELLTGAPAEAVTQSGSGALMLVVGARGSGGFTALLLGSVSRYAAMEARCPVVVVREETSAVHREVVVGIREPYDADAMLANATLAFAFEEAARRRATLIAVHSHDRLRSPHLAGRADDVAWRPADAERTAAKSDLALAETLGPWRDKYPTVPVWQDVVQDHPAHVLASYSARADLVVIGRYGEPGARPAIGTVQHALLNHAHGPVAVVPATE